MSDHIVFFWTTFRRDKNDAQNLDASIWESCFRTSKIGKFKFKVTVHYELWVKSSSNDPLTDVTSRLLSTGQSVYSSCTFKKFTVICQIMRSIKGTQMGPLLVLVCPCFRENVIVTCKIVSFSWSLVYFLLKNVIIFYFGNQISKWCSFKKKRGLFLPTFYISSHQGERHKNSLSAYLTYIHTRILLTLLTFCLTDVAKITNLSCMASLWCDS